MPSRRVPMSSAEKCIFLQFDSSRPYGSAEHYHHFLLGYLLPCVHVIGQMELEVAGRERTGIRWHLRSCGPVMDRVLAEALSALGIAYRIESPARVIEGHGAEILTVPRFDRWCAGIRWGATRRRSDAAWSQMMAAADRCAAHLQCRERSTIPDGSYLLIRRSEQPEYYRRGGPAEIAEYGTGRRSLLGTGEAEEFLQRRGIHAVVFEPGLHTLAAQIDTFRRCRGVIAIRGAELANIVWMRPGCEVFMFHPPMAFARAPEATLAALVGVKFVDIPVPTGHHRIDPPLIERMLRDPSVHSPWSWAAIRRRLTASIARLP